MRQEEGPASHDRRGAPKSRPKLAALIVIFVILALGMFSRTMNHGVFNDEHMYVTAGVLAQDRAVYRDFAYLQMPYLPFVCGAIYELTGTSHYLLLVRMCSFGLMVLACFLLFNICYHLSRDALLSTIFLLLFTLNHAIIHVLPLAWNQVMPLSLSILAFYFFIRGASGPNVSSLYVFLAGLSAGIAVGTKLTYAVIALALPAVCLFCPRSLSAKKRLIRLFLPAIGGLALSLLPALVIMVRAGLDTFLFNNLGYHIANTAWREAQEYASGMSLQAKIRFVWEMLGWPGNVSLLVVFLFVLTNMATGLRKRRMELELLLRTETLLAAILALLTAVVALQPRPLFTHYFAAPVPFIIILICSLYAAIPEAGRRAVRALIVCAAIVTSIFGGPILLKHVHNLYNVDAWTGISTHQTAQSIRG